MKNPLKTEPKEEFLANGEKVLSDEEKRNMAIDNIAGRIDPTIKADPNLPKVDPAHETLEARKAMKTQEEKAAKKHA